VAQARRAVEDDDVPEDLLDDVRLVLSELVTNSLRHSDLRQGGWIGVRTLRRPGGVRVEVCDPGPGFPPPPPLPRSSSPFGGRGLLIVDRLASRWGAHRTADGRWEVWADLDRQPRSPRGDQAVC